MYMLMVGSVSTFISDAATVAMMIPIGMSVVRHVRDVSGLADGRTNFGVFITLGTLYAAVAGETATVMGIPHNGIAVAMLVFTANVGALELRATGDRLTGRFAVSAVGVGIRARG